MSLCGFGLPGMLRTLLDVEGPIEIARQRGDTVKLLLSGRLIKVM